MSSSSNITNLETKNKTSTVILWGVSASPYVRKVIVALNEKSIPFTQKEILPTVLLKATHQAVPIEFEQISPLGKIPALQIDNFSISDSAVICAYLENKFSSGNSLYPRSPEDYAKVLWFEQYSDHTLTDIAYRKIFFECVIKPKILGLQPDVAIVNQAKQHELPPLLNFLDKSLASKMFIAGQQFSVADIAVTTQLLALLMAGFEIKTQQWKYIVHYLEKMLSRPSLKKFIM